MEPAIKVFYSTLNTITGYNCKMAVGFKSLSDITKNKEEEEPTSDSRDEHENVESSESDDEGSDIESGDEENVSGNNNIR